ncbi:MAG: NifU family protein [Chloroherpetonaceae bacterium]
MQEQSEIVQNEVTTAQEPYLDRADAIYAKVQEALDMVRPYLQSDGGDAELIGIRADKSVDLRLVGACGSCPMSTMTLRAGVEQAIKRAVPEVTRVEAIS